ncbi:hypothetical protein M4951_21220 [Blastopirellula sp. J2-11]|uniref:hypothetical protein n=1 Tax=Blastopirellula sp. J2-11 TaxID=2943192 RepID=UPI0021C61881|nr:hypothetical protein [Blastopirellula sp. J2-11]UUO05875.1 hypothetical protein M4951_21220 [Blastopirellula sp. J2-11]
MNPLSLLLIIVGGVIQMLGVIFCIVNAGDAGINMPLLIGVLVVGSMFETGAVFWHILQKRI